MTMAADFILRHKKAVLIITAVLMLVCAVLSMLVDINYNLTDYLPDDAPSTQAIRTLNESASARIPNLNVCAPVSGMPEALALKSELMAFDFIEGVLWLDDVADVTKPLEMLPADTVESWYNDGYALFRVTVAQGRSIEALDTIREHIGEGALFSGEASDSAYMQTATMGEISKIMVFAVPLVLIFLLFATSSWLEPILFIAVIGVAIVLNMGTNIIFGEISFVTNAASAILQLAVSMDYAVFLLHSFARHRQETPNVAEAMKKAMTESAPAIAASMMTTLFGFLSLCLMKFKIGPDMGLVLAKGVLLSFVAVMILLPVIAIWATKLLDKTRHRSFLPKFDGFARFVTRICVPLGVVITIIIVPSFFAQQKNDFIYGSSSMHGEDSQITTDGNYIKEIFGTAQQMIILVPEGSAALEAELSESLKSAHGVTSVISYSETVGITIPEELLDEASLSQLRAGGYSRIILYADVDDEGDAAMAAVEDIRAIAAGVYGEDYYLIGQSAVNYDLKSTVTGDNFRLTMAAIVSIALVLLVTFRSLSLPIILLLTIEGAIWINLSITYFMGNSMNFIGYQIVSSVQLGATVDYGILMTSSFMRNRETMDKKTSVIRAVSDTAPSVLTPAFILFTACAILGVVSSNGVITQLGTMLGRGALISVAMVLMFLPSLFMLLDPVIQKTTLKKRAGKKDKAPKRVSRATRTTPKRAEATSKTNTRG